MHMVINDMKAMKEQLNKLSSTGNQSTDQLARQLTLNF